MSYHLNLVGDDKCYDVGMLPCSKWGGIAKKVYIKASADTNMDSMLQPQPSTGILQDDSVKYKREGHTYEWKLDKARLFCLSIKWLKCCT